MVIDNGIAVAVVQPVLMGNMDYYYNSVYWMVHHLPARVAVVGYDIVFRILLLCANYLLTHIRELR